MKKENKKISLHLNSNRSTSFEKLIKSIVNTTSDISKVEVIVHIDSGDKIMEESISQLNERYPNLIRTISSNLIKSFADAWKPLNIILESTSETVKFISCISDDIQFITKNWDEILLKYENYYLDNIIRIRCSKFRYANYTDVWQCGYMPDSYAFYSKKWFEITKEWNPCIGPDSYNECISYYLKNIGAEYDRDIINKEIDFLGQEVSTNLDIKTRMQRSRIYYKAFFKLMSFRTQKRAYKKALLIAEYIAKKNNTKEFNEISISILNVTYTNFKRRFNFFYHRGSPNHIINNKFLNIVFMAWCYISFVDALIINIYNYCLRKKIIKDFNE